MCSITENHINMLQHRKEINSSNTVVKGLDLRRKDHLDFLHSIDSHQMVKNVCAYQEYFQWYILLAFSCNMGKHFGTKPIREWLYDNKWKVYHPNWETYYFFISNKSK